MFFLMKKREPSTILMAEYLVTESAGQVSEDLRALTSGALVTPFPAQMDLVLARNLTSEISSENFLAGGKEDKSAEEISQ